MPQHVKIYSVGRSTKPDVLDVNRVFDGTLENPLSTAPISAVMQIGSVPHLLIYDPAVESAQTYAISNSANNLNPVAPLQLGKNWDAVEPFVIGNQPHLMCYQKAKISGSSTRGIFHFVPITTPLGVAAPLEFYRTHEPGITKGFTTVKSFTAEGGVAFLGYCQEDGRVAIYTLSVTAASPAGIPPLLAVNVWSHQWAQGWTRFAFFQFGSENFFFKINVKTPNVNIDHVLDGLAGGTVEVATQMKLDGAQKLDAVAPLLLAHGEPYLVTYLKDGTTTIYRFHADCSGWTKVSQFNGLANARNIAPFNIGSDTYIAYC